MPTPSSTSWIPVTPLAVLWIPTPGYSIATSSPLQMLAGSKASVPFIIVWVLSCEALSLRRVAAVAIAGHSGNIGEAKATSVWERES